jgi:arylsulfatase A-like enzyme
VIVTSDHGQEFDDHGDFGHGFQLYSELTRVPLLLHRPGGAASRVMPDVSTIDILPPLRSLTGAPRSPQDRGTSLLPGDAPAETRAVFSMRTRARDTRQKKRAVVRDGLKLIVTEPERSRELYDLRADPGETQNLAATRAEDVRRLEALLAAQNARDGLSVHERAEILEASPELVEQLEELGYADDGPQ